jgi:hypothetical protein
MSVQGGEGLARRSYDDHAGVDSAFDQAGDPPEQRGAVPLERRLG